LIFDGNDPMNSITPASSSGNRFNLNDDELEALYSMAHQLHTGGMRSKAHDLFVFIAACRPRTIRYNKALGVSLMSNGDYEAAIPILATAILCSPGNDPALSVACAECLALTNRHQQARRLFKKAKTMLRQHDSRPEINRLATHADGWLTILKDR
jgi:tetratricopeptide (TPR) repeat protein